MSFQKAQDLLKLAHIAASRHQGVTVKDISTEFSVNERTAQRMQGLQGRGQSGRCGGA